MARELSDKEKHTARGQFAESARAPATPAQPDQDNQPQTGVTTTAREEITNGVSLERQLNRHDDLWKRERNKIASASDPYPEFDLGSRAHRNIQREYDERRFVWEQKRDEIENRFSAQQEDIRAQGHTLSDEFTFSRAAPAHTPEHTTAISDVSAERAGSAQADTFFIRDSDARDPSPEHEFAIEARERSLNIRR